jgi:hypothetical protein
MLTLDLGPAMRARLVLTGHRLAAFGTVEYGNVTSLAVREIPLRYLLVTVGTKDMLLLAFLLCGHLFASPFFLLR